MKMKNLTKEEIIEKLKEQKNILEKYGVKRIGLFGSFVRGEQRVKSDIDLVVDFDPSFYGEDLTGLYDTWLDLMSFFENLFGRKVDILTPISIENIRIKKVAEEIKRGITYV